MGSGCQLQVQVIWPIKGQILSTYGWRRIIYDLSEESDNAAFLTESAHLPMKNLDTPHQRDENLVVERSSYLDVKSNICGSVDKPWKIRRRDCERFTGVYIEGSLR